MEEILESPYPNYIQDQRKRKYTTLAFVLSFDFIFGAASSLQGPLYPAEATKKGVTASVYGAVIGFSNMFLFIFLPLISISLIQGRIGNWRFGVRGCLLTVFFIESIIMVLFGFLDLVNSTSVFTFFSFVLRGIDGIISAGGITLPVTLYLAFPDRKALAIGLHETAYFGGLVIGPLIGEALFELGGFIAPYAVAGLVELSLSTLAYFFLPRIPNPPDTHQESMCQVLHRFMKLFQVPSFSLFFALITLSGAAWGFLTATLESDLEQFSLSPVGVGLMFSLAGIPLIATPVWGILVDWTGRSILVNLIGTLSAALGAMLIGPLSFLPFTPTLVSTAIGVLLVGVGQGALLGSNFYNLVHGTRNGNASSDNVENVIGVSSFYIFASNLGLFLGPTIGGILLDDFGFRISSIFQWSIYVVIIVAISTFTLVLAKCGTSARAGLTEFKPESSDEVTPLMKGSKSGV